MWIIILTYNCPHCVEQKAILEKIGYRQYRLATSDDRTKLRAFPAWYNTDTREIKYGCHNENESMKLLHS